MNEKLLAVLVALACSAPASAAPAVFAPATGVIPTFRVYAAPAAAAASLSAAAAPSLAAPALTAPGLAAPALSAAAAPAGSAAAPSASAAPSAAPASAAPASAAPAASAAPSAAAAQSLQGAATPLPAAASADDQRGAGVQQFDGGAPAGLGGGSSFSPPDNSFSWYDQHTGQFETQTTKIKKAYDLALSHPLAAGIKNGLSRNTLYRVDNAAGPWYLHRAVRAQGDDSEKPEEAEALVIFNHNALQQLSPEFLAAKLASMWVRHLYRDTMPASAEKTYVEGSVLIRVFMGLTGSTEQNWNGDKDYFLNGTFELYRHFYHWIQGFRFPNVRQGPYFLNKIMHAQGDPAIDADARGRSTLFQRAQSGQITQEAAGAAQQRFDGFVSNEQH